VDGRDKPGHDENGGVRGLKAGTQASVYLLPNKARRRSPNFKSRVTIPFQFRLRNMERISSDGGAA
jgi:hypothetical protein